jgi:hypothetical protein
VSGLSDGTNLSATDATGPHGAAHACFAHLILAHLIDTSIIAALPIEPRAGVLRPQGH